MANRKSINVPGRGHRGGAIPMGSRIGNVIYSSGIGTSDPDSGDPGLAFADVHARARLSTAQEELTAVRSGPLKLIFDRRRDRARLFDVVEDPEERHDRADQEPEATRRLLSLVRGYLAAEETAAAETDLSPQEIDLLRQLGYAD